MAQREIVGARAIVTGASSGIGRELADELSRRGARLLLTARRENRLRELCEKLAAPGREATFLAGDITDPHVRNQLVERAHAQWHGLDLLVNNAGCGAIGPFCQADESRLRRIMEVNFFAPVELIRAALPLLEQGNRPLIVNVSSVLGHRAVPNKSEYCASKFALHGFSDALRAELSPRGIELLLVSPSTTESEFFDNVLENQGERTLRTWGAMSAKSVARKIVRAIRAGSHETILSPGGKLLVWLDRLCPPLANRLVTRFG
jgi:short-subunit dehydrogenase